ncbi:hypothetical protein GO988_03590 [Hymenobacter sp. HMF4947]|uniref:PH domain-containing protein n=1 Tax=Hymenobacter ginkgonis TaxID=2682976 RepID=A0A7K1TB30_9BACT|nr:hypothetical protein [Hymenobacter ginkgonis]MVN75401.1 hypothetical protein [Hymenobacter ginkgonis]
MPEASPNLPELVAAAQPPVGAAPEALIRLYPRRYAQQQRAKALSHLVPALVLLTGGMAVLGGREPLTPLLGLEFGVGASYLLLMARELRHLRHAHPHHEQVAWLELAAAGILGLEGYHIWHRHHAAELAGAAHRLHVLPWLYAGLAVVYVSLAFGLARLGARRYLHLHPGGFGMRTRLLGPAQAVQWPDLASVEATSPTAVQLHFANGRQQALAFGHLHDGASHCAQLLAHTQQHLPPPA